MTNLPFSFAEVGPEKCFVFSVLFSPLKLVDGFWVHHLLEMINHKLKQKQKIKTKFKSLNKSLK